MNGLLNIIDSWVRMIEYAESHGNKYPTVTLSDLRASMTGVLKEFRNSVNASKSIKCSANNGYTRYELIDYFDVWGNAEDGWEVNNQSVEFDDLMIANDCSDEEIIDFLIEIGYLSPAAKNQVMIEFYDSDWMEIVREEDYYPICCLKSV